MATQHHLADDEFAALLAGEAPGAAQRHLDDCDACRHQSERLSRAVAGLRASLAEQADRRDGFWTRQRAALLARAEHTRVRAMSAPLLAAACLLVALALGLLNAGRPPSPPAAAAAPAQDMLIEVERTLEQPVPDALAPATLLTDEIVAQTSTHSPKSAKEKRNEI